MTRLLPLMGRLGAVAGVIDEGRLAKLSLKEIARRRGKTDAEVKACNARLEAELLA
jgi:hypothetical protein